MKALVGTLLACGLSAQIPNAPPRPFVRAQQLPEPAVPADPLELVNGEAQPVQSIEQRASAIKGIERALSLSNVRAFPYYRKTTFTSFGSTASDGAWQLEDMSPGRALYRWSAQGPAYSVINLYADQTLYSNQPAAALPVRLTQVRTAIFFVRPMLGPRATLRTASGSLNGAAVQCVLVSNFGMTEAAAGGRRWEEAEYCTDSSSGALVTYSPAPGLYVLYDYSQAIHFHDRLIPNKFTITEAGRTIIEAQTVSVSDPPKDEALFQSAGLTPIGVGSMMTPPSIFRSSIPSDAVADGQSQIVVLRGMRSSTGQISDVELLASSNITLNTAAMNFATSWRPMGGPGMDVEPGATPQSHEVLMTLTFFRGIPQPVR